MNNTNVDKEAQNNINENRQPQQPVIIQNNISESNGIWTAWFVLALLGLFLSWIPIIWRILWFLWLVFSSIWIFKKPKWLAMAWLIISLIDIIVLVVVIWWMSAIIHSATYMWVS